MLLAFIDARIRGGNIIPHVVEWRVEDAVDSLDGNVEESGSRRAGRERVDLEVGTPHELGRVGGDAAIPPLPLILGD